MRILLIGEYSRLHNSLKEGLLKLGHEVVIVAAGDGFKKFPVDIKIDHSYKNFFLRKFKVLIYKLTKVDLGSIQIYRRLKKRRKNLINYDVVQLINESSLKMQPSDEIRFLKFIFENNKKVFLLSCGVDFSCMNYMMSQKPKYSLMTPYLKDKSLKKTYQFQLKYLTPDYKKLHDFIVAHAQGIISTDLDYHLPLKEHSSYLGLIPNPINIDQLATSEPSLNEKIKIFHGINTFYGHKKGNQFFTKALDRLTKTYPEKVDIIEVRSLPYVEYMKRYIDCHILLDQVYGYDQGYNALEAMARGKVVFTGAEQEWLDYYGLMEDTVAINALPDADIIFNKLEWLVLNPEKITEIGKNARAFIEKEHDYIDIAQKYLDTWKANN